MNTASDDERQDWLEGTIRQEAMIEAMRRVEGINEASDTPRSMQPLIDVQNAFGQMGPQQPREIFTEDDPPLWKQVDIDKDPIPTDGLLGLYNPIKREIKIYRKPIGAVAKVLQIKANDLTRIVRIHEYGHAIVHLGIEEWLSLDCDGEARHSVNEPGDWELFLEQRTSRFTEEIDNDSHEILAQSITWILLASDKHGKDTFLKLMARQPPEYQLSDSVLANAKLNVLRFLIGYIRRGDLTLLPDSLSNCIGSALGNEVDIFAKLRSGK